MKRDPTVVADSIIIRVNLMRHIIFRDLQVCLVKYLQASLLDTRSRGGRRCCHLAFQREGTRLPHATRGDAARGPDVQPR